MTRCCSWSKLGQVPGIRSLGLNQRDATRAGGATAATGRDRLRQRLARPLRRAAEYQRITLKDLASAVAGIDAAVAAGFPKIKLNAVLMRGKSETQLLPLLDFARERGAYLRFIELMPLTTTQVLTRENFLPAEEARRAISESIPLERAEDVRLGHGPAVYYRTPTGQLVGFIGAMTDLHFCDACNKIRLTSDGKIRPCLGNHLEFDLKSILRGGGSDDDVADLFRRTLGLKPAEHEFRGQYRPGRSMTAIGG
ncbi:MAG: GTP 3',8-cyclase MoaA [Candidatus Eisenbacteria bacterium]